MIISASRRTDIPAFYADWMMQRLREGYVCVRNPYSAHQVSRVSLTREEAEAIVFWTKDATAMLPHLDELDGRGYKYFFQYTMTPYGTRIEPGVDKKRALETFLMMARRLGKRRMIWRYDPILMTDEWTAEKHVSAFERMCGRLEGATERCVISFVDLYASVRRSAPDIFAPDEQQMREMARAIAGIAHSHGMTPSACAEAIDLSGEGIEKRGCIDERDLSALLGVPINARQDGTQRAACRCVKSVDIGAYDTCRHGCIYCYAKTGRRMAEQTDVDSPILAGRIEKSDRITERKEKRIIRDQLSLFD